MERTLNPSSTESGNKDVHHSPSSTSYLYAYIHYEVLGIEFLNIFLKIMLKIVTTTELLLSYNIQQIF